MAFSPTCDQISSGLNGMRIVGKPVEILPDRVYFLCVDGRPASDPANLFFNFPEAHYEPFYNDFGPLNLAVLYRFCTKLQSKLKQTTRRRRIVFYCGTEPRERVNAAYLVASFAIICDGQKTADVWNRVRHSQPPRFVHFRDAAMGISSWDLGLRDVLSSIEKAVKLKWLDFTNFNVDEYEKYERVENGDFNWIIPGKFLAFCGPHQKSAVENGYPYHSPETYFEYFRSHNVTTIVRLNKKMYDATKFSNNGFEHVDLFFVDGSTPSDDIVKRFIDISDKASGAVAVHCKAGLGRTGTLIACWMMKELGLTAAECIAWTRVCRPGCVIGPQQHFLLEKQSWCWALGGRCERTGALLSKSAHMVNGQVKPAATTVPRRRSKRSQSPVASAPAANTANGVGAAAANVDNMGLRHGRQRVSSRVKGAGASPVTNGDVDMDDGDPGQGDRLCAIKAARQHFALKLSHSSSALYTSPTTPVKPMRHVLGRPAAGAPGMTRCFTVPNNAAADCSAAAVNGTADSTALSKTTRQLSFDEKPVKVPRVGGGPPALQPRRGPTAGQSAASHLPPIAPPRNQNGSMLSGRERLSRRRNAAAGAPPHKLAGPQSSDEGSCSPPRLKRVVTFAPSSSAKAVVKPGYTLRSRAASDAVLPRVHQSPVAAHVAKPPTKHAGSTATARRSQ